MTKAVANRPFYLERRSGARRQDSFPSLFGGQDMDAGSDENDGVIRRLIGDRGKLEEDADLNDGNSAYSDHPSNGPHVKNWPATE